VDYQIEGELAGDERRVFVATRDGVIRALDRDTGAVLWKTEGPARRVISARNGSLLARSLDGTVTSLSADTGAPRWKVESGVKGDLPAFAGKDLVVVAGEGGLAAFEPGTGRPLWTVPPETIATAPPALAGSCLAVGEADGTLRCREPQTGATRWAVGTRTALLAPPVADERGQLYVGTTDRRVLSLDPSKGKRRWKWDVGADVQSTVAISGEKVLVAAFDAVLYAFHSGSGNLAWRSSLPSRPLSPPLVTRDAVIVACHENEILGFDLVTGRRIGGLKTAEAMRTPPILRGARLFVGLRNRSVQALDLPGGVGLIEDESEVRDLTSERH
jgi:outer membrane protein assembly factor BamB